MSTIINGTSSAITFPDSTVQNTAALTTGGTLASATITALNTSGITFPATQVSSSNANTLDDYEEGTWTPNQGVGLTVVGAFSSAGTYVKIGRVVTVTGRVTGATSVAVVASGIISSNLPFSSSIDFLGCSNNNSLTANTQCYVATSTLIYNSTAISATTNIFFSLTYYTAT